MTPPRTEEDVKIRFLMPLLEERGYLADVCEFEKGVEVHEGRRVKTIFADVVVHASAAHDAPLVLCETKAPTQPLDKKVREQAISYARLLPRIPPLTLITNGDQVQVFHTLNKERLTDLPDRNELAENLVEFTLSKSVRDALRREAKHELFIIDDVQTFKLLLRACHNAIRNNDGLDPTAAFDEMSKVLFCKMYEERKDGGNRFRASTLRESLDRFGLNVVRQIFDETKADERFSGLFEPGVTIRLHDRTIEAIVELFEDFDLSLTAFDVKGEAFEYFLGDTFTGGLGEYFTPRNVVEFMVDAIGPRIGERIVDPFCGTGGFLIYAFDVVSEKIRLQDFADEEKERWRVELSDRSLFGTDWKERTSQACRMNMIVHGDGSAGIFRHDGLTDVDGVIYDGQFDICLTNPPFGSFETDREVLARYELGAGRASQSRVILAMERSIRLVRPGGRVAIVVIDGILNNRSTEYVRDWVRRHAWIDAVVSLPPETFQGYGARAKTSVVFLTRKEGPDEGAQAETFFAIADNTGYAPNGQPISGNELPEVLMALTGAAGAEELGVKAWREAAGDRLDAEFYYRPPHDDAADAGANPRELTQGFGRTLEGITAEYESLAEELGDAFEGVDWGEWEVGDFLEQVSERVQLEDAESYRLVGVRWWGGGAFVREEKYGREIGAKSAYVVRSPRIVYNKLFAFRGSFAVVAEEMDGCHASVEFPTFEIRQDIVEDPDVVREYIVHCMNSAPYLERIDAASTGSTKTSRNRFHPNDFLAMTFHMPTRPEDRASVVRILRRASFLKFEQERLKEEADAMLDRVGRQLPGPRP